MHIQAEEVHPHKHIQSDFRNTAWRKKEVENGISFSDLLTILMGFKLQH